MWLLGDTRLVREDTMLFFRKLHQTKTEDGEEWKRQDSDRPEMELEEVDYAQVLQQINHFLPVNELAGHAVDKETLKQFGLIDNEKADEFLATIFAREAGKPVSVMNAPKHEPRTRVSKNRKAIPRHPTQ
jgi:hypothetical protein